MERLLQRFHPRLLPRPATRRVASALALRRHLGQPAGVRRTIATPLVAVCSLPLAVALVVALVVGSDAQGEPERPAPSPMAAPSSAPVAGPSPGQPSGPPSGPPPGMIGSTAAPYPLPASGAAPRPVSDPALRQLQGSASWPLYDRFCLPCHGAAGDGAGPAAPWLWPPPRDFSRGQFKWRSTPAGAPPLVADVRAAITYGVPASGMPGFADVLDDQQRDELAALVLALAPPSKAKRPAPLALGAPPAADPRRGEQLWQSLGCAVCHGAGGRGDGPAAPSLRDALGRPSSPRDLAAEGARRPRDLSPRAEADLSGERLALATSIATGLDGTPMVGFAQPPGATVPKNSAELWALADFLLELRQRHAAAPPPATKPPRLGALAPQTIAADEVARLGAGVWPGAGDDAAPFGGAIAPQGAPPARLAPAQASLSARQCARCHASQYATWTSSVHAAAGSPGLLAQLVRTGKGEMPLPEVAGCLRCHAPLAEQAAHLPLPTFGAPSWLISKVSAAWPANPAFSAELRGQGITCAACHVRSWQRLGPPHVAPSLLALPGYPKQELAIYERADFCLPCHQLPPRQALDGRPLLNTYKEWLDGPYFRRGVQCQHCHMPNREHTWKGIHDAETFRQGATLTASAVRGPVPPATAAAITVRASLRNAGAGHYLPTTPTPAVWLELVLSDEDDQPIPGTAHRVRIGRHIAYVDGAWRELEDSRIAPGEALEVAKVYRGKEVAAARRATITVRVQPDEYYIRFYKMRLASERNAEAKAAFQEALQRAENNSYSALRQTIELP